MVWIGRVLPRGDCLCSLRHCWICFWTAFLPVSPPLPVLAYLPRSRDRPSQTLAYSSCRVPNFVAGQLRQTLRLLYFYLAQSQQYSNIPAITQSIFGTTPNSALSYLVGLIEQFDSIIKVPLPRQICPLLRINHTLLRAIYIKIIFCGLLARRMTLA